MVLWLLGAFQVHASGNDLLSACSMFNLFDSKKRSLTHSEYFEMGQCLGAVTSVRDTFKNLSPVLTPVMKVCLPVGGISNRETVGVAVKFMRDNPTVLVEEASVVLMKALHEAYPCPLELK